MLRTNRTHPHTWTVAGSIVGPCPELTGLTKTPGPLQVEAGETVTVVATVRVDAQLITRVSTVQAFVKICTQRLIQTNDDLS